MFRGDVLGGWVVFCVLAGVSGSLCWVYRGNFREIILITTAALSNLLKMNGVVGSGDFVRFDLISCNWLYEAGFEACMHIPPTLGVDMQRRTPH